MVKPKRQAPKDSHQLSLLVTISVLLACLISLGYLVGDFSSSEVKHLAAIRGYSLDHQVSLEKISQLIVLPEGEFPASALVSSTTEFSTHPHLSRIREGDYVLIYEQANLIVVYRPSVGKIVATSPVKASQTPNPKAP